jgi:hypothetical protein
MAVPKRGYPFCSEKPDRFKKVTYHWYNGKTCQVYFQKHSVNYLSKGFVAVAGSLLGPVS